MKPNIAFIGLGVMGHRMLTNMRAHGGFSLVGGWDPSPVARERTRAAARRVFFASLVYLPVLFVLMAFDPTQ
ncbi:MAG: NAD(P)-binding domain-containing protein [Planctomycetota bacterium]